MLFEDLDIKSYYDSRKTDVYNEFFNIVLPQSTYYMRYGGFFSAKRFALMAEGLQEFIINDGIMELAIIPIFSKEDIDAMIKGIDVNDIIARNWIDDFSKIKEKFLEDHRKALSWMIANEFLTVKLVIPEHDDGTPLFESELKNLAILNKEIGIFYNKEDKKPISFHGTIDRDNLDVGELYSIDVSRHWFQSEKEKITSDHEEFINFWDGEIYQIGSVKCRISPLTNKLKEYFRRDAPQTKSKIPDLKKLPVLRKYQNLAVASWMKNSGRGILEMATGTGKTFTAISCIKKIESKNNKNLIIVAVPYNHLLDQWNTELHKWNITSVILGSGEWRQIIRDEISHINRFDGNKTSVLIISHVLFARDDFITQLKKCKVPTMLIVDEAHHVGTLNTRNGLTKDYQYRLGLSATIERYYDQDGTQFLREYFKGPTGSTVANYSLKDAIKDGKLCEYNYYPSFIELTENEFNDYQELTYRAVRLLNSKEIEKQKRGEELIMMRAKIVRDATNKLDMLQKILKQISEIKHLLIFCSEKQFDSVENILNNPSKYSIDEKSILFRRITYENPKLKKDRTKILNEFADENWNVLLSNRILDEGMDIPQARNCIVLASTGNPTQFIQRRGRVLRPYSELYKDGSKKTHANIYDILVRPQINNFTDHDSIKLELGMIHSQLARITQMGELALNKEHCLNEIKKFTYGLTPEFFDSMRQQE